MRHVNDVLMTALRVLTAVVDHKNPNPVDIRELQRLSPNTLYLSADEMACDVIHRAMQAREKSRTGGYFPDGTGSGGIHHENGSGPPDST